MKLYLSLFQRSRGRPSWLRTVLRKTDNCRFARAVRLRLSASAQRSISILFDNFVYHLRIYLAYVHLGFLVTSASLPIMPRLFSTFDTRRALFRAAVGAPRLPPFPRDL